MAILNPIRDAMHSPPFRPFTVHDADGSHFIDRGLMVEVPGPDAVPAAQAGDNG
jgi:hypothetical protein